MDSEGGKKVEGQEPEGQQPQAQGDGGEQGAGGKPGDGEGRKGSLATGEGDPPKQDAKDGQGEGQEGDDGGPKFFGAPEGDYEFTTPEGFEELDMGMVEKAAPILKDLGLNQEGAQKLVDFFGEYRQEEADRQAQAWKETQEGWIEAAKTDKEFGGDAFDENVKLAQQLLKSDMELADEELIKGLEEYGFGNHPAFIRYQIKVARLLEKHGLLSTEDKAVTGERSDPREGRAKRMFPNMN